MINKLKIIIKNIVWRKMNIHNYTVMASLFPMNHVLVGKRTYGKLNIICYNPEIYIKIGNYCSIGDKVTFLMGGEHNYRCISTYPFYSYIYKNKYIKNNEIKEKNIIIEDDVWIGYGALIFPGVKIGKGSVIGAQSIVLKDVPPYSIYAGTKVIKKRFSEEIIKKISKIDFASISHDKNDLYQDYYKTEIDDDNVDEVIKAFETKNQKEG